MIKEEIYNKILSFIPKERILREELMKNHTSFKVGGPAECFIRIASEEELRKLLEVISKYHLPIQVLGNGTNVLVKDGGIEGITIVLDIKHIRITKQKEEVIIQAGAGVSLIKLALELSKEGIERFEFATGIPGTIGGAVKMNAGAFGGEMKDIVVSTKCMDLDGNVFEISNIEHNFKHRSSVFEEKNWIVLETTLKSRYGDRKEIEEKVEENKQKRISSQPIDKKSAGSTFKRGEDYITAKLIDEASLKGYNVGDAKVSNKHAGFLINDGNASAKEILTLIEHVKKVIYDKFKKEIELEIKVIGKDK